MSVAIESGDSPEYLPEIASEPDAAPSTLGIKIERIWELLKEVLIKEFCSVCKSIYYYVAHWINPHAYGLDSSPTAPAAGISTAKVVILLHGQGGGPFCFMPIAEQLEQAGIRHLYTVSLSPTEEDPVPVNALEEKIREISQSFFDLGYTDVDIALVGHSLGALVSSKYIWRVFNASENPHIKISMMIAIAGRLRYLNNPFSWFCQDVRPEIETTYAAYLRDKDRAQLYTISGSEDGIVPPESVHISNQADRQFIAAGYGHGGVVNAPETAHKISEWAGAWAAAH